MDTPIYGRGLFLLCAILDVADNNFFQKYIYNYHDTNDWGFLDRGIPLP